MQTWRTLKVPPNTSYLIKLRKILHQSTLRTQCSRLQLRHHKDLIGDRKFAAKPFLFRHRKPEPGIEFRMTKHKDDVLIDSLAFQQSLVNQPGTDAVFLMFRYNC